MHAAAVFADHTPTVSAEREDGSTPGARVTWSTTVPPECAASVTVEFRSSSSRRVMRSYTTTSTSETKIIQTGLQCGTTYYIRVVVTGVASLGIIVSNQVFFGGEVTACTKNSLCVVLHTTNSAHTLILLHCVMPFHRYTSPSQSES